MSYHNTQYLHGLRTGDAKAGFYYVHNVVAGLFTFSYKIYEYGAVVIAIDVLVKVIYVCLLKSIPEVVDSGLYSF